MAVCVAAGLGVEPQLVAAGRLPVKFEAELLQALDDLPVAKAGQAPHQPLTIIG